MAIYGGPLGERRGCGLALVFFSRRTFCIGRPTKTASIMMEGALNVGNYVGANKNSKKVISMGALIIQQKKINNKTT